MPYKDIAEITGVSSGTVMSRLWRLPAIAAVLRFSIPNRQIEHTSLVTQIEVGLGWK
jgi:hypothetical protein